MMNHPLFQSKVVKRLFIFLLLALALYAVRSMLNIILITFIVTYLMNRCITGVGKLIPINRKLLIIIIYLILFILIAIGLYKFLPNIIAQIKQLIKQVNDLNLQPQDNPFIDYFIAAINNNDLTSYVKAGFDLMLVYITNVGKWGLQFFIALILSLFFVLEKQRIIGFTSKFKQSKIAPFYNELEYFGTRFVHSFGKVIEVQFIIATINCILSVGMLAILGFPQLFSLGLMIFLLGLIPVAGVVISLIPLCTIAFTIGGISKVIWVLVMIAIIHSVEAYVLNPKLMSSKTNLPVFYTFVVLIFFEHFFGVWGLIVGIPIFIFLLDVLNVVREPSKDD